MKIGINFSIYSMHLVNVPSVTGNIQLPDFYESVNRMVTSYKEHRHLFHILYYIQLLQSSLFTS